MDFMQRFKDRFESLRASGNIDAALVRWRKDECAPLMKFSHLDELVDLLEIPEDELKQDKDVVVRALCELARGGDEEASLLLIWLFLGVFRKTQREIGLCRLSEEELQAEMLAGFWEEVSRDHDAEENVAARLFYAVHNRAWKAIRWANRGGSPDPDVGSYFDARGLRGDLPDPTWLIERAKNEGVLSPGQADLIQSMAATPAEGIVPLDSIPATRTEVRSSSRSFLRGGSANLSCCLLASSGGWLDSFPFGSPIRHFGLPLCDVTTLSPTKGRIIYRPG